MGKFARNQILNFFLESYNTLGCLQGKPIISE